MPKKHWHKVLNSPEELPEGRVTTATAGNETICLTHYEGKICALTNKCPHQGGPLGEGSIEKGWLRCPWHGWDFHPHTGESPGGHGDRITTFEVEVKADGVYVAMPEAPPPARTVSDVMVETMVNWGVDTVFGMVGHSNLGFADALRRAEERGDLRYFGIRHEGAASFAASAYGKLTGRPAACFAIAGPGATNLYTGLWDAKVDRVPILALTGQVDTQVVGTGAFQELDLVQAFGSLAAFNHRVLHHSQHAELMNLALKHAILQRDVAHLTFPDEVQVLEVPEDIPASGPEGRMPDMRMLPARDKLQQAIDMLRQAKRPVIILGHGARFHIQAITALAERLRCPVLTTFKGKGLLPDAHPLACGVLGRSGTPIASYFMNEADLLCVFGASFSNHTGISSKLPIIQVDFDPLALAKFHPITVPLLGEIGVSVQAMLEQLDTGLQALDHQAEIAGRWRIWREEKARRLRDNRGQGVSSVAVFEAMNRHTPAHAVIAVDVGNNTYSFGRYFEPSQQSILMSGYLGSIGFGYPAAMGAWAAAPERPIVAVTGDGGFGQYMGEVTTAVKYGMPIKHVLLNNSELGKISKEQRAGKFAVWQTSLQNPNFAEYARSCGALGIRVSEASQLDAAMQQLFAHPGPACLEVLTDVKLI
ncbi:MAG: thiamine pyrophosphate-binding protein [Bacteroidetes bacterium]|nr:MAG: thiamine pyrophosphate-binding protein [Bacteroidota bacterium]